MEIADVKMTFTDSSSAQAYLRTQYGAHVKRNITGNEDKKIKQLAKSADDALYLYPVDKLDDAIEYIKNGKSINGQPRYLNPSATPPRVNDDTIDWEFAYIENHNTPSSIEIPQSPLRDGLFPETKKKRRLDFDLADAVKSSKKEIKRWKKTSAKSHYGNNNFAYKVSINYRLEELESSLNVDGSTSYAPLKMMSRNASKYSDNYTSRGTCPPQKSGGEIIDHTDNMKEHLDDLYDNYNYGELSKCSLFTGPNKDNSFFKNAKNTSIGTRYYHSEVQASSDEAGIDRVVKEAVEAMVAEADELSKNISDVCGLVVIAVIITGYSDSRTVCGNACKPALVDLSKSIETKFTNRLNGVKASLTNIKIRRSGNFNVSAHIGAAETSVGVTTGAKLVSGTPSLQHHQVSEYKP